MFKFYFGPLFLYLILCIAVRETKAVNNREKFDEKGIRERQAYKLSNKYINNLDRFNEQKDERTETKPNCP